MIFVTEFDQLCQDIVNAIDIKGYVLCSTEEQGMKKLKDKSGIQLVAVYPNYSFDGQIDTYKDNHEMLFFTVIRQSEGASDTVELRQYYDTQQAMIKLKQYLFGEDNGPNNFCRKFPNIDVSSVMIDPEYNIFGGYIGWSIKLVC